MGRRGGGGRRVERRRDIALHRRVAAQNHGRQVGPEKRKQEKEGELLFCKLSRTVELCNLLPRIPHRPRLFEPVLLKETEKGIIGKAEVK